MPIIKQSSTTVPLVFFIYASADHLSGLIGATPTATLSKNGAAFASPAGTVTEIGNGFYKVAGNATDTNTLGLLCLSATASGGDQATCQWEIVAFDPQVATNLGLSALPTASPNTNGGLPILSVSGTTLAYTLSTLTTYTGNTPQTGDAFARIGATGSGLTSLAQAATALSNAVWTAPPTGFLTTTFSATVGTSTLTQSQVTGGAFAITNAGCVLGDARIANLDAAVSSRSTFAGGAVASVTGSVGSIAGITFPSHFSALVISAGGLASTLSDANVTAILASVVKIQAAAYDSAPLSGSTMTLSNAATMTISSTGRVTT